MHTQDVYASEKSEIGSWTEIGYDTPTSAVFDYTEKTKVSANFEATPKSPLDGVSGTWKVVSSINSSTGKTTHTATVPTGGDKLTPNFENIGGGAAAGGGE